MKTDFDGILGFIRTVEAGNFSAAARELNISPSAISKQIARLEQRLGVTLFVRNSRGLNLTEAGQDYYKRCAKGIAEFRMAEEQIDAFRTRPAGVLRIAVPQGFGSILIAPHIPEFSRQYPELSLELSFCYFENHQLNAHGDVIISTVDPPNESMVVRPLLPIERVACASPTYIKRHGRPATFADLQHHNCVIFTGAALHRDHWIFRTEHGSLEVAVSGNLKTNSYEVNYAAAVSGMGIALMPTYIAAPAIEQGRLIALFRDYQDRRVRTTQDTMNLYYPQLKDRLPKVRAFVEFVTRLFDKKPAKLRA
jgi:DNA-binding transcriptional LysR family regulator